MPIARYGTKNIIANPNCSTIQMVVALKPIHDVARIKAGCRLHLPGGFRDREKGRQGTRRPGARDLRQQGGHKTGLPHQIAFNCLPHIDVFFENGYTKEEMKMVNETKKIMEDDSIRVTATTVRVPVFYGHSESVNIENGEKITADQVREILSKAPG